MSSSSRQLLCSLSSLLLIAIATSQTAIYKDPTSSVDDRANDLLIKIKQQDIQIINVYHDVFNIGGIHLFHGYNVPDKRAYDNPQNNILFEKKQKYNEVYHSYLELSEYNQPDELMNQFIKLCQV
jgi:hypothetical protein